MTVSSWEEAIRRPRRYVWGEAVCFHEIGPYRILEHRRRIVEGLTVTRELHPTDTEFHLFIVIEGIAKDTNNGYSTLDAALVGGIAYRVEGGNSRAAEYFMRMIGGATA